MHIYYYLKELQLDIQSVHSYETLLERLCTLLNAVPGSLVVCKSNNTRLQESEIQDLKEDSALVVYDNGRVLCDGLNKEGVCVNPECKYYRKRVIDNCGFVNSERIFRNCTGKCGFCGARFDVSGIYLKNCHYDMAAIRDDALPKQTNQIDAENLIPRFDDISPISLSEHYIFDVKPMDEYVCKNCHTEIDHDHQCERVHRKSLCEKCVNKK